MKKNLTRSYWKRGTADPMVIVIATLAVVAVGVAIYVGFFGGCNCPKA